MFFYTIMLSLLFVESLPKDIHTTNFTVFGYLPEYRLHNFDYMGAFKNGLTHLIFFSLEVDPLTNLPSALDRLPSKTAAAVARTAANSVNAQILLSFGGNARSQGFGAMSSTKKRRTKFLTALNDILTDYSFDGVDYNWEYPRNSMEWQNWGKLMKESKYSLLSGNSVVSFTMYLDRNHYNIIKQFQLLQHADFLHCMAYDAHGQHSTMDFAHQGLDWARQVFGADARKWTLGVPFYGRNVNNGEPKAFYELYPLAKDDNNNMIGHMFYNSPATIVAKTKLAWDAGAGGIMIWELGQDVQPFNQSYTLMSAVRKGLEAARTADSGGVSGRAINDAEFEL